MSNKVYEIITNRVLEIMDKGVIPWRKPWKGNRLSFLNISGHEYSGINRFMLSLTNFETPLFLTFHQAKKLNGEIKKGATAYPIFFYSFMEKEDAEGNKKRIPIFRYSNAFNIEQCDGISIPKKIQEKLNFWNEKKNNNPIESAQSIVENMQNKPAITINHDGNRACYFPMLDSISVPEINLFEKTEEYYSTLFHELGHSTGHASRLNRETLTNSALFGSHQYSIEELIAEFTATFLACEAGIERETIDNSAAYLQSWAQKLKEKPNMLAQAASRAQKAADYILGVNPQAETEE